MFFESRIEDIEVAFIDRIDRLGRDHSAKVRKLQTLLKNKKMELDQLCESFERQKGALELKIKQLAEEKTNLSHELESERSVHQFAGNRLISM